MIEELVAFWFAPTSRPLWFERDAEFDAGMARFAPLTEALATADHATAPDDPRWSLGACLALDQVPRNTWRGSPRAFASDRQARAVADRALALGHDRALADDERLFLYLPFEHSESMADQDRSVALFKALGDANQLDYAVRHRDIIARFGRFPHRNAILGRASAPAESAFLLQPGSSF